MNSVGGREKKKRKQERQWGQERKREGGKKEGKDMEKGREREIKCWVRSCLAEAWLSDKTKSGCKFSKSINKL